MNDFLTASLVLCGNFSRSAGGPVEAARRLAIAAVAGPKSLFLEALDVDGLLEKQVGPEAWHDLTGRQRDLLRSAARERFLAALAPPSPAASGVAWSAALPSASDGGQDALVGLRLGGQVLKTRWLLRRPADRWRIRDVVLSDPGISLAQATAAGFGTRPLVARRGRTRVLAGLLPPLAALVVIAIVVALAAPRLPPPRRRILNVAAAGAALVFLVAGVVAAARGFAHPYDLVPPAAGPPWRASQERARAAERAGRAEEARAGWERALREGAPAGPVAYERGLAARQRGDAASARAFFQSALSARPPSPGAGKELAALDAAEGRLPDAERQIAGYLAAAGPDPEALTLAAVIATDLGKTAEGVASIEQARRLSADGSRGAELEAQIRARAGAGRRDRLAAPARFARSPRAALRADPVYLTIATDPAWVAFINESTVDSQQSTGKKP
jgi:tetratricopeptide (TPR) repeat protein